MTDEAAARTSGTVPRSSRVIFIHIPKTGGTTLNSILRSNASNVARLGNVFKGGGGSTTQPDYERMVAKIQAIDFADFFWGHTPFAVAAHMPPGLHADFITFLRDPVERALSQYYSIVDRLGPDAADGDSEGTSIRTASRKKRVARTEFGRHIPVEAALTDVAFVADNLQTRMLCGEPQPFGEVTSDMLERAIENLGRFRCVGVTERFDESLVLLKHRIGYTSIVYDDRRVNSSRPRGEAVPDELRVAAAKANAFDSELYRHALALFDAAPERDDLEFQVDLAALRSARAGPDAPLSPAPEGLDPARWLERVADRRSVLIAQRVLEPKEQSRRVDRGSQRAKSAKKPRRRRAQTSAQPDDGATISDAGAVGRTRRVRSSDSGPARARKVPRGERALADRQRQAGRRAGQRRHEALPDGGASRDGGGVVLGDNN